MCILILTGFCVAPATAEPFMAAPFIGIGAVELGLGVAFFLARLLGLVALEEDLTTSRVILSRYCTMGMKCFKRDNDMKISI